MYHAFAFARLRMQHAKGHDLPFLSIPQNIATDVLDRLAWLARWPDWLMNRFATLDAPPAFLIQ